MTELEKAAKEYAEKEYNDFVYIRQFRESAFIAGANYQKSLPDPSLEEIKERFKNFVIDKNWLVEPGFTVKRALDIFEFFTPFIKGDADVRKGAIEMGKSLNKKINELKSLLLEYEQWEADIIAEDKLWWPHRAQDVLRGPLYDKMLELQQKRNELFKEATKAGTVKQ